MGPCSFPKNIFILSSNLHRFLPPAEVHVSLLVNPLLLPLCVSGVSYPAPTWTPHNFPSWTVPSVLDLCWILLNVTKLLYDLPLLDDFLLINPPSNSPSPSLLKDNIFSICHSAATSCFEFTSYFSLTFWHQSFPNISCFLCSVISISQRTSSLRVAPSFPDCWI